MKGAWSPFFPIGPIRDENGTRYGRHTGFRIGEDQNRFCSPSVSRPYVNTGNIISVLHTGYQYGIPYWSLRIRTNTGGNDTYGLNATEKTGKPLGNSISDVTSGIRHLQFYHNNEQVQPH